MAADAGRRIDPEHFGVSIGYTRGERPEQLLHHVAARHAASAAAGRRGRARAPRPTSVTSCPTASRVCAGSSRKFVDVGFSKFVLRPLVPPGSFRDELEVLADGVLDLQS